MRHWQGTAGLTRQTQPLAEERLFLLGDAAGYVEPFTGEGIAWALASAQAVAPLARRAMERWDPQIARDWSVLHRQIDRPPSARLSRGGIGIAPAVVGRDRFRSSEPTPRVGGICRTPCERPVVLHECELIMPVLIAGIGTAVPPHRIAQADAAVIARPYSCETPAHERVFNAVYEGTGVKQRGTAWFCKRPTATWPGGSRFTATRAPPRRDRMRMYEDEASTLALVAAQRRAWPTHSSLRNGSRTWSPSRAAVSMRPGLISP